MARSSFTDQVYKKARDVITNQKFTDDWQKFMSDTVKAKSLLAAKGPAKGQGEGADKLRKKITDDIKDLGKSDRGFLGAWWAGGKSYADEIIVPAAKPGTPEGKWAERVATIKMLKHFYRYSKRGSQDVWIYSPPKAYSKWIFDELKGSEGAIKRKLRKEDEVYSTGDKKIMCDALLMALNCAQKTVKLLGDKNATTVAMVKSWFAESGTTDAEVNTHIPKLLDGFKKISAVCNSTKLVFSDDPADRKSRSKYNNLYGSVFSGGEGDFPVIYLAGAFKKAGNSGKLWLCAQTIIHEASHLEVRTKDHRYDTAGLKPDGVFPHAKAVENADSWGYFAIDLCGKLSKADRDNVLY